jgi:Domain of unknown function(DUF2779)
VRSLSKSKLLSFRQCPKKLWLEDHHSELKVGPVGTTAGFAAGKSVGAVARRLYDPKGAGQLIDVDRMGYEAALQRSRELLESAQPVFEAGFASDGAVAFADVMLPVERQGSLAWRMVEVKSAAEVKEYHRDDAAIQAFVARRAGVRLENIAIAHVDSAWEYPGDGDYRGLLAEEDVTDEVLGREDEVRSWIAGAHGVVSQTTEPVKSTGSHCDDPFPCGFLQYCQSQEHPVEYPVSWLPNVRTKALKAHIAGQQVTDLRNVPDELLNPAQRRVKVQTSSGEPYFDAERAAAELARHPLPAFFLDFETISFAVPIWKGTRPYQPLTFQFSVHRLSESGEPAHRDFLDLSGTDPREALADTLIAACEKRGPVFVYSSFEASRIRELAKHIPRLKRPLSALLKRLVDLRPIAEQCYYHPSQEGSWSIKKVLPAVTGRGYEELDGVKDGGMAMEAYLEAIAPESIAERKAEIERELRKYCALDTEAMIEIWRVFSAQQPLA